MEAHRMRPVLRLALALALWSAPAAARAHNFVGTNELSGAIGGQVGVNAAPGGGKLLNEYGYRMSNITWLNLQLNFAFGGGRDCVPVGGTNIVECGSFSGDTIE